ncbi:piggyBac transposable element-derived protein 3 [Hyalella azteca]|uniref:PiggyBac transposable element-derived protein 3 n=1 Tax=Hyalella azteca TaxID=294128 RepID=A0A8B7NN54_HYAAZ|nr:piggyBac transposable element-derived protein 3 [Hyalella azteca]
MAATSRDAGAKKRDFQSKWSTVQDAETVTLEFSGQDLPCSHEILPPFQYFKQFISDDFLDVIVTETNMYSVQKNVNKPLNVTHNEMEQWLGLICYFSISKLPHTSMHWCKRLSPLTDICSDIMSRDRFEAIKSNFHLVDNTMQDPANADNFLKVRPMIDHLRKKFQDIPMIQNLCVDEQLVPFKGRSPVKQYIPNKPKKWAYKFFVLADEKGMTYDFIPYNGRIKPVEDPDVPDLKPSSNSVLHLAQIIPSNVNHHLFFDNWFTSLPLVDHLASRGIWSCGTVRPSRLTGLTKEMKCQKQITKNGRGAYEAAKIVQDNSEALYVKWFDNRVVNMISTFAKTEPVTKISRYSKNKTRFEVQCPDIVKQYNKSMGGVALADQLISLYRIPIRPKKYYMRLVFHMIDMVVVNSWLLYRRDASSLNLPRKDILSLASFKLLIAFDLMKAGKVCNGKKRGKPSLTPDSSNARKKSCYRPSDSTRTDGIGHLPRIDQNEIVAREQTAMGEPMLCVKSVTLIFA